MIKIQTTRVFEDLIERPERICVFQGSSRASKTYNILIYWVYRLLNESGKTLSIVRKTLPALKSSVLKDLKEILIDFDVYDPEKWKTVDGYYELGDNRIEWFSVDDETKVRGRKRDYLFVNEATEVNEEEWTQLLLRTTDRIVCDLNPSLWNHWVYDLEKRDDCFYTIVTFEENPFLPEVQKKEIRNLKDKDENLWRIFGLGQKGNPISLIFTNIKTYDTLPIDAKFLGYGMDFGFHNPTTVISVYKLNDQIFVKEELYVKQMTMSDIVFRMNEVKIDRSQIIWCDSALPQNIQDLKNHKFTARPVSKQSILHGINLMKQHEIFVHRDSKNIIQEFLSYSWKKDREDNLVDIPEDDNNHAIDAIRYCMEMTINKKVGNYKIL